MSLFSAALGGIGGVLGGLIPEVTGYFRKKLDMKADAQEHEHEMARLEFSLNADIKKQKLEHDQEFNRKQWEQVIEEDANYTARLKSITESQTAQVAKSPMWVVAWNAILRPSFITVNIGIFTMAAMAQGWVIFGSVSDWTDPAELQFALNIFWANELIAGSISGTIAFLLGYRSARALPKYIR